MNTFEDFRKSGENENSEEVYSKSIRAGHRTYFFDVKSTRGGDYYLTITESRRKQARDGSMTYDKHKIYLYKEDFEKFTDALTEIIGFINENNAANGARDIREFRSYRNEQPASAVIEEAPVVEAAPATEEKKYDFDVDFEI